MSEPVPLEQLRDALVHLYDLDYLEAHPLAQKLSAGGPMGEPGSRGLRLRRALIESIESLKPEAEVPDWAPTWRQYMILRDRYVRRRPLREIEEKLSLGDRQVRREHRRALAALAVLVRSWLESQPPSGMGSPLPGTVQEAVRRLSPAPRVFGLSQLVEEVVAILAEASKHQGVTVKWHVQPGDLTVYTDRGILHQLLVKLLQTFQRHRVQGTVSLQASPDDHRVVISVASDTIRIQVEDEDLRVCQWLAQCLRTGITVEREGPEGTRLSFALPVGSRLRRVLIIDDEQPAIELFQGYLNGLDYQVIGETMAERALQRAVETQPDVIVLDVMMPAVDGWELLQRLRHTPELRDVPIIVCSVLDDAELAFALGAARFLRKPVLRQQLVAALQEACAQTQRPATAPPASRSAASQSPSD
jgi:CheY-like chemotaxis protein